MVEIAESKFKAEEWSIKTQHYAVDNEIGFIMVRENADGSRSVIAPNGTIETIPKDKFVDNHCGPYCRIPVSEFDSLPEPFKRTKIDD